MTLKNPILQRDAEAFFEADAKLRAGYTTLSPEQIATALATFHKQIAPAKPNPEQYRELAQQFAATLASQARPAIAGTLNNGIAVRAACMAGLLPGLTADSVGDMSPGAVLKLATDIGEALRVAFEMPGE